MRPRADTIWLESRAKEIGFDLCGVVAAEQFPELARSDEWLAKGFAGEMKYLEDPRRTDASRAMPGIRSVVVCGLNYNSSFPRSLEFAGARDSDSGPIWSASHSLPGRAASLSLATEHAARPEARQPWRAWNAPSVPIEPDDDRPRGWISRYAWGSDYHDVLRERLEELAASIRLRLHDEPFDARVYSDTGPIQERIFAKYAGLGWLGKNTLLLNQRLGSWFFLGAILTTLELEPSLSQGALPAPDLCGTCRKCVDACPTQAFREPYVMDARRCIAYLTIELRGSIPEEFREAIGMHVFGCDICQDVCPWNRRAPTTPLQQFQPRQFTPEHQSAGIEGEFGESSEGSTAYQDSLFLPRLEWLASLTEAEFREKFRGSAIKRTKWRGLVRNACVALGNATVQRCSETHVRIRTLLQRLSLSEDAVIAESALWALRRIESVADQSAKTKN